MLNGKFRHTFLPTVLMHPYFHESSNISDSLDKTPRNLEEDEEKKYPFEMVLDLGIFIMKVGMCI